MRKLGRQGIVIIETIFGLIIFFLIITIFINVFIDLNKNIVKSQQFNDLQRLNSASLSEVANQLRQAVSVRTDQANDIPVGQNFILDPNAGNQVVIFVPKLSNPGDKGIADRITYNLQNFNNNQRRLMQQLTTFKRDVSNNVIVDTIYAAIPVIISMELYRAAPAAEHVSQLAYLFNNPHYQYENVSFYWDYNPDPAHPRGVMAIGITMRARTGFFQSTYSASTIVTARTISGVPR